MEGPCGPPDDGTSKQPALWRCFASCAHCWGALAFLSPAQMRCLAVLSSPASAGRRGYCINSGLDTVCSWLIALPLLAAELAASKQSTVKLTHQCSSTSEHNPYLIMAMHKSQQNLKEGSDPKMHLKTHDVCMQVLGYTSCCAAAGWGAAAARRAAIGQSRARWGSSTCWCAGQASSGSATGASSSWMCACLPWLPSS